MARSSGVFPWQVSSEPHRHIEDYRRRPATHHILASHVWMMSGRHLVMSVFMNTRREIGQGRRTCSRRMWRRGVKLREYTAGSQNRIKAGSGVEETM